MHTPNCAARQSPPLRLLTTGALLALASLALACNPQQVRGLTQRLSIATGGTGGVYYPYGGGIAKVISDNLDGIEEINFVAHSLGNLVIRHYLADQTDAQTCRRPDPRIKRIVMLGPPNNGTKLGQTFGRNRLFELLGGASARQLARGWQELDGKLATPQCQFGIIAGGRGDERGRNPILEGDDDFVVRVEETRLAGARDFLLLPVMHATMIHDRTVHGHALRFLRHGYFRSDAERQPIVEADQSQK